MKPPESLIRNPCFFIRVSHGNGLREGIAKCNNEALDKVYEQDLFENFLYAEIALAVITHIITSPVIRIFNNDNGNNIFHPIVIN